MRIVKLKTNKGRVLYAIQKGRIFKKYLSLDNNIWWSVTKYVLTYAASPDLKVVEERYRLESQPEEKIIKVIPRKCKCK